MTRDEIMGLSGEALDMAVAEHIFGWYWRDAEPDEKGPRVLVGDTVVYQGLEWLRTYHPGHQRYRFYPDKYIGDPTEMPAYSGNIMDAWLVVDKMQSVEGGMYFFQISYTPAVTEPHWVTEFGGYYGIGDTAPVSICRAALIAKMMGAE